MARRLSYKKRSTAGRTEVLRTTFKKVFFIKRASKKYPGPGTYETALRFC
jgi:hypothetical protein